MPRSKRILLPDVCYHVVSRGNNKQVVFHENKDIEKFQEYLWKYKKKFKIRIYSHCPMPTHIHLLLDPTSQEDLNKMMHGLKLSYTRYFNYKYKKTGHLWGNRYNSFIVAKDSYLFNCINYIEYNPVRAGLVEKPEDYKWSSYNGRNGIKYDKLLDDIIM